MNEIKIVHETVLWVGGLMFVFVLAMPWVARYWDWVRDFRFKR